ncbi:MAG: hypothetical protein QNL92_03290 [Octadecabacter sp.]
MSDKPAAVELAAQISAARDPDVTIGLCHLILSFGNAAGLRIGTERHGEVGGVAFHDGDDWCYSFCGRQHWVLGYIRPPEYRKGLVSLGALQAVLPHAKDRGDEHLVVRLHGFEEANLFVEYALTRR